MLLGEGMGTRMLKEYIVLCLFMKLYVRKICIYIPYKHAVLNACVLAFSSAYVLQSIMFSCIKATQYVFSFPWLIFITFC